MSDYFDTSSISPLNFFRKIRRQYSPENITKIKNGGYGLMAETISNLINWGISAPKFLIPSGGKILDSQLRGLPEDFRLPFSMIICEYFADFYGNKNTHSGSRCRALFCVEGYDGKIELFCFTGEKSDNMIMLPFVAKVYPSHGVPGNSTIAPGVPFVQTAVTDIGLLIDEKNFGGLSRDEIAENAYANMIEEVHVVLGLIEALSCKNVGTNKTVPQKINKSSKKNNSLPFDSYHVLSVLTRKEGAQNNIGCNDRPSPREHLRRGHIRRLDTGNIWINSTVVNAGARGKIFKSYAVSVRT